MVQPEGEDKERFRDLDGVLGRLDAFVHGSAPIFTRSLLQTISGWENGLRGALIRVFAPNLSAPMILAPNKPAPIPTNCRAVPLAEPELSQIHPQFLWEIPFILSGANHLLPPRDPRTETIAHRICSSGATDYESDPVDVDSDLDRGD